MNPMLDNIEAAPFHMGGKELRRRKGRRTALAIYHCCDVPQEDGGCDGNGFHSTEGAREASLRWRAAKERYFRPLH